jgi:hypothetical protein
VRVGEVQHVHVAEARHLVERVGDLRARGVERRAARGGRGERLEEFPPFQATAFPENARRPSAGSAR